VKLSDTQSGRIGEYLLSVYAMITTDGVLVPFQQTRNRWRARAS
jgi:hypothetical protein